VSLNALPVLSQWFMTPDDWYLLPVAVGAASLHMTTIDKEGASAMGFHLDPAILELDPYSGDFGIGFFGHMLMAASIFVRHPDFGPLCFLCDSSATATAAKAMGTTADGALYRIVPRDSVRRRVFLEPLGVLLEVEAGRLVSVDLNGRRFTVHLADDGMSTRYRVRISTPSLTRPALKAGVSMLTRGATLVRGAYQLPLSAGVSALQFGLGKGAAEAAAVAHRLGTATGGVSADVPRLPDHAHERMRLVGSPHLRGFEGGWAATSVDECARLCAAQQSRDPHAPGVVLHLRCQAWTFALAPHSGKGRSWCWLFAGRGNARGNATGFWSAMCDNRPAPATDWPCCQEGFSCPNPIGALST